MYAKHQLPRWCFLIRFARVASDSSCVDCLFSISSTSYYTHCNNFCNKFVSTCPILYLCLILSDLLTSCPSLSTIGNMNEPIRKKNILNLIKYHIEENDHGFRNEAYEIARSFDSSGDHQLSEYILGLLSDVNTFVPQGFSYSSPFLTKVSTNTGVLPLPTSIQEDIIGVVNAVSRDVGINKFLFEGHPGTGKTESAKQVARILQRELYMVDFERIIDSKMGQTSKNIAAMFNELQHLPHPEQLVVLFDEIDAIALDRVNNNDIREMGRATSSVLKGMDSLNESIVLIATTNLYSKFDNAMIRRFDFAVNFDRYSRDDLLDIAEVIAGELLDKFGTLTRDKRLLRKIINTMKDIPYPGELRNTIKSSISFSDPTKPSDYFVKLYRACNGQSGVIDIEKLQKQEFTLREMEALTGRSRSQLSRDLTGDA